MSFQSYETTRPWARSIKDKVVKREMPPWAADPHASMKFRNDRSLSQQEIDTIVAWANAGAPRGNPADAPPAPTFASGWQLGEPDFVFEQPIEWTVKPDAQEPYLYFYEKIPFTEDKWAAGVEIRPSNFSVVHHSGVYVIDIPDGHTVKDGYMYDPQGKQISPSVPMGKKATSGDGTPLAGADKIISYVPGRGYEQHPEGYAKRIPAGKYVRWVMHYNPIGETDDRPQQARPVVGQGRGAPRSAEPAGRRSGARQRRPRPLLRPGQGSDLRVGRHHRQARQARR